MVKVYFDNSSELAQKFSSYDYTTTPKTCKNGNNTYKKVGTKNLDHSDNPMYRIYLIGVAVFTTAAAITIIPIFFSEYRDLVARYWKEAVTGIEKFSLYLLEINEPIQKSSPQQPLQVPPPPPERQSPPPSPTSLKTSKTPPSFTPPYSPETSPKTKTPPVNRKLNFDEITETPIPKLRTRTFKVRSNSDTAQVERKITNLRARSKSDTAAGKEAVTGIENFSLYSPPPKIASTPPCKPVLTPLPSPISNSSKEFTPSSYQPRTPVNRKLNFENEEQLSPREEIKLRENLVKNLCDKATALSLDDHEYADIFVNIHEKAAKNDLSFNIGLIKEVLNMNLNEDGHLARLQEIERTMIDD